MRVGNLRAGHADEVDVPAADRVPGCGNIGHAASVQDGQINRLPNTAGDGDVGCCRHSHWRDPAGQTQIIVGRAGKDIEEVHRAALLKILISQLACASLRVTPTLALLPRDWLMPRLLRREPSQSQDRRRCPSEIAGTN